MTGKPIKAIVTFGPTNESIDDVMKITNMSTGRLGIEIALELTAEYPGESELELWLIGNKTAYRANQSLVEELKRRGVHCVYIGGYKDGTYVLSETDDMLETLEKLMSENKIDYVFHASAVGDYAGRFATNNLLLAEEIYSLYSESLESGREFTEEAIADILASPSKVFNQDTKMSSDEPHMIVGFGLTPKVIGRICGFAEANGYETNLVSWKLQSGASRDDLYNIALSHGRRNGSWQVVANDLSRINGGDHWAMVIDVNTGKIKEVFTKDGIAKALCELVAEDRR